MADYRIEVITAFVEKRGYRCYAYPRNQDVYYKLEGPRGNSHDLNPSSTGVYPLHEAEAWCDKVDRNTKYVEAHKAPKNPIGGR